MFSVIKEKHWPTLRVVAAFTFLGKLSCDPEYFLHLGYWLSHSLPICVARVLILHNGSFVVVVFGFTN